MDSLNLNTLEQHWGESDAGSATEHNVIVITAKGQPFEQGIMLDNWRRSGFCFGGRSMMIPITGGRNNKAAFNCGLRRKAASTSKQTESTQQSEARS